jgi:hypothetical protein
VTVKQTTQMGVDQAERAKELAQAQDASLDQIKQNPRLALVVIKFLLKMIRLRNLTVKVVVWRPSRGNNRLARGLARGLGR